MFIVIVLLIGITHLIDKITKAIALSAMNIEITNNILKKMIDAPKSKPHLSGIQSVHIFDKNKNDKNLIDEILRIMPELFEADPNIIYGPTEIKITGKDEDGNFNEIYNSSFSSPEEFAQKRDEILAKFLGIDKSKDASKALEEMGISELEKMKNKAVEDEDYKKAALLRDKIEELKNKQNRKNN